MRWVATETSTLGDVLARMGLDAHARREAIDDGRVFVGRHRATDVDAAIRVGDRIEVHAVRDAVTLPEPFVIHRDDGLLAVDKPAGIPTIPDLEGARGALVDIAARAADVPRNRLHPTSRLDRDVSGVVLFAEDEEAAGLVADAREAGRYLRRYVAVAHGSVDHDRARWTWAIGRDRDPRKRRVDPEGRPSASRMRVVRRAKGFALLALAPETGRTHQLRVHAAAAGLPLVGDRLYGPTQRLVSSTGAVLSFGRVALHCAKVEVELRRQGRSPCIISLLSPVPPALIELAERLGLGGREAFEEARTCDV